MTSASDIAATQQQLVTAIENIYTNFKKDSASRKSADYIKKRLDTLDCYWVEYESNFSKLKAFDLDQNTRDYINRDIERVKERYNNIRAHIQSYQETSEESLKSPIIKPPSFTPGLKEATQALNQDNPQPSASKALLYTSSGTASKSEEKLRKQSSNFKAFHRTILGIDLEVLSEKWEFEDLLRTVQARWDAIDSLHWDLDSLLDGSNEEYESTFSSYENKYQAIKKAINKKMWSAVHVEKTTPRIEIPTFSGNYNNWISFKDLFSETIHNNNSMSKAQKMQYLKSKVRGEADRLIQHLNVSSDNYSVCWDILNQRYNNKKLIFTSHMNVLMNLPVMQQQSVAHIKRLHDTTQECLNAIKNLGVDIKSWDPIIVYLLTQKLDTASFTDYVESVKNPRELPVLSEFLQFLELKFTSLEASRRKQDNPTQKYQAANKNQHNNQNQKPHYYKTSYASNKVPNNKKLGSSKYKCVLCNSNEHRIYYCQQFLDMPAYKRLKTVTKLELCKNCLYNHQGKPCTSDSLCRECNKDHNRLLHDAFVQLKDSRSSNQDDRSGEGSGMQDSSITDANAKAGTGKQVRSSSHVSHQGDSYEVLLPTALINVQGADGSCHVMRALMDQGSQTSLITEHAAQLLKIPRRHCKGVISGVGNKASNSKGLISIRCSSTVSDFNFITDAIIMNQLTRNLPNYTFLNPDWSYVEHLSLADPEFYKARPIDILLGADVYSLVLMEGICRASANLPTAQQTQLGWILSGNAKIFQCNIVMNNIEDIQKFWEIEDVSEQTEISVEDKQCIDFYRSTTVRREDGRYEVRLPLKSDYEKKLGLSKSRSIAQFYKLEQKLIKNPSIAKDYTQFIHEYVSLGHMIPSGDDCHLKLKCYLPHHCVTREESTTTKLRVVFNASDKTSSGVSLNDVMYRGPNLQQDLLCLIIKWRQYKYAFTADIEKMFRQIWVNRNDQHLQMILWRDNQRESVKEYRLATVTYGTKAAPFLAMMTLKQLAYDESMNYQDSSAPSVLKESFYTDDLIHGAHSVESAKSLQVNMINLLRSGGFNLRKWKSNSPELLENVGHVPVQHQENFDFKQVESTKTLGLGWSPQQDCFTFQSKIPITSKLTKRTLLSDISKIFDPLGWLSPLTTKLKILFQEIWKANIQWDELVPHNISEEWNRIQQDIHIIEQFEVPRWMQTKEKDQVELHGFCDASTKAYGCVVYCKIKRGDATSVTLVAGKTKLVPLSKNCSLPRLELCGAVLLSKLMAKIKECLINFDIIIFGWLDSMVVLGWINGEVDKWRPFVANRVKQITTSMPASCWRYVTSKENPADCASRGLTASQLKEHQLWWEGPTWLPTYVPEKEKQKSYYTNQEMKNIKQINVTLSSNNEVVKNLLEKQSSLTKAVRILAWALRFTKKNKKQGYLCLEELNKARITIIKSIQHEVFAEELSCLKECKTVSSKSKINCLNPVLDENGVIRVGGRLRHANMDSEMKHPAIIPNDTRLADLIIDQAHELTFHGGARLTTAFIRRKYWLIGGNSATKKRLRFCVKCRKQNPNLEHQLMGDLPAARVNPSRPFHHCGIDYTGHVNVKANKGRGIKTTKGYVAVFVCMATKAVHLELVSDLTTSAFLAALRRMASRRGVPGHIYTDQGTNFIGADKVLRKELSEIQETLNLEFKSEIASMGIEWHFNAPSWPSAGGLWEAAVKSLKHHLKRVIGEQHLTFEEFSTLLSQLEGCLNSRPLCSLTEDPDDLNYLTPSHFLSSGPLLTLYDTEKDLRTRWHLTQKIFNDVWSRWREEYLTQLTARSKWRQSQTNIKLNDVVMIKDDNLPPGKWALGRVVELHPGSDGFVRVVTLKTKNGFMKRPVVKLSILPVNQDQRPKSKEDKNEKGGTRQLTRKNKTFSLVTLAISLLLFFVTVPSAHCFYNITPLQGNNSIYFDRIKDMQLIRDDWQLVIYYDTQPYQEGNKALAKYINYLDSLCEKVKMRSHCDGVMLQLRHEVSELQYYNDIVMNHNAEKYIRHRRGLINGVGYLANSLFGVLDESFAEKYERDIALIRENQNHIAVLWKNQTSVVEAEFNLLKRTESIIDKNHKLIHKKFAALDNVINKAQTEMQNMSLINDFLTTAMIANNMVFSLRNIQQTLLDAVTNIYNGKFNYHLLTPKQLWEELGIISEQLPKDLSLPVKKTDSLSEIYKLLQTRARVTAKFIIFEIKIPLIGEDMYEILRLIPIPHLAENERVVEAVPVANYVGVNLKQDSFMKLNEEDLRSCLPKNLHLSLCHFKRPIYLIKDDQSFCETLPKSRTCKTITRLCDNKWVEMNKVNTYLYFCCEQCHMKLVCNDQITPVQLVRSGFFNVGQGCTIKSADSFIYSYSQGISKINVNISIPSPEISQINHIVNISVFDTSTQGNEHSDLFNHTVQLQEIQRKLEIMRQDEPLIDRVSNHDVHHYIAIYSLFALMGIVITLWTWWNCRRRMAVGPSAESTSVTPPAIPERTRRLSAPGLAVPSTGVQCSVVNELCNKSARVSVRSTLPSVRSARVLMKETGSSPIAFRPEFVIPDEHINNL